MAWFELPYQREALAEVDRLLRENAKLELEVKHLRAQLKTITHSTRETVAYLRDLEGALTSGERSCRQ